MILIPMGAAIGTASATGDRVGIPTVRKHEGEQGERCPKKSSKDCSVAAKRMTLEARSVRSGKPGAPRAVMVAEAMDAGETAARKTSPTPKTLSTATPLVTPPKASR